jgi:twitching motility protein PilT
MSGKGALKSVQAPPIEVPHEASAVNIAKPAGLTTVTSMTITGMAVGETTSAPPAGVPTLGYLLKALVKYKASDMHLKADRPPLYRMSGKLVAAKMPNLTSHDVHNIITSALSEEQAATFESKLQVDAGIHVEGLGRFRLNAFHQKGGTAAVVRMIPLTIPTLDGLGMPEVLKELALRKRGLILVTGSTGSGKSTTLAAMLQYINANTNSHIITIEDPIEFLHSDLKSSLSQREIGADTVSAEQALMGALRQDPDVIMLGELRRKEMIEIALTAAETGHLVLSTLHTNDAKSSLDRIIDVFPGDTQNQVRVSLAASLTAVISQRLVPRADGKGRVPVCEVLIKSRTIQDYILSNELDKIDEVISTSGNFYKMQTFNQHLEKLVEQGIITKDEALVNSNKPDELKMRMAGLKKEEGFHS